MMQYLLWDRKWTGSGCLYGLSGQGSPFSIPGQFRPAFLTVCNAVGESPPPYHQVPSQLVEMCEMTSKNHYTEMQKNST